MKETWKKLLWPFGMLCIAGGIGLAEANGWTEIQYKTSGVVQDVTLEARRGLPTREERIYGVSQIWKMASDYFACWALTDEDMSWDEAYKVALEEAGNATTSMEYYWALRKFLANLNHGGSEYVGGPNISVGFGALSFSLGYYGEAYVVTATRDKEEFPIGTIVETVNGEETGQYLERTLGDYLGLATPGAREHTLAQLMGPGTFGEQMQLEIRRPGQKELENVCVERIKENSFLRIPSYRVAFKNNGTVIYSSDAFDVLELSDDIGCFVLKSESSLDEIDTYFEDVVPLLNQYDGIILDWRSNAGGNSLVGRTIVESFIGESIPCCTSAPQTLKLNDYVSQYGVWNQLNGMSEMKQGKLFRSYYEQGMELYNDALDASVQFGAWMHQGRFEAGKEIEELVEERYEEYLKQSGIEAEDIDALWMDIYKEQRETSLVKGKPVVMLVSKETGGSGDSVAAEAKAAGVTLVGTRTRGATGTIMPIELGGGWVAAISTQRSLTPEGEDITNNGVEPDVYVDFTAEDLALGHDGQLEVAMEVLKGMVE